MLAAALDLSAADVFAQSDRMVTETEGERVGEMLRRVLAREPLSRILGVREFWSLEFELSADTLDPRPESETIVEAVIARLPERERPYRFLDLGTGSGCLLLALLSRSFRRRGASASTALMAPPRRRGAMPSGWDSRREPGSRSATGRRRSRDGSTPSSPTRLTSLAPISRRCRARCATSTRIFRLDGGADGLEAYRAIAAELPRLLSAGGTFAGEIGQGQEAAVAGIISGRGLVVARVAPDLAGIARCVVAHRPG